MTTSKIAVTTAHMEYKKGINDLYMLISFEKNYAKCISKHFLSRDGIQISLSVQFIVASEAGRKIYLINAEKYKFRGQCDALRKSKMSQFSATPDALLNLNSKLYSIFMMSNKHT